MSKEEAATWVDRVVERHSIWERSILYRTHDMLRIESGDLTANYMRWTVGDAARAGLVGVHVVYEFVDNKIVRTAFPSVHEAADRLRPYADANPRIEKMGIINAHGDAYIGVLWSRQSRVFNGTRGPVAISV
jgi:hypothetical protein